MASYSFRTGFYFPAGFTLAGSIVAAFGVLFLFVNFMVGLPVTLLGVVVATTHYRLVIDTTNKTYKDCIWFLGFRTGHSVRFESIEYLFINTSRESQTMHIRVVRSMIHKRVFSGYIKFSDSDKVHIGTRDSKPDLMRRLQPVATALRVPINDYTTG